MPVNWARGNFNFEVEGQLQVGCQCEPQAGQLEVQRRQFKFKLLVDTVTGSAATSTTAWPNFRLTEQTCSQAASGFKLVTVS